MNLSQELYNKFMVQLNKCSDEEIIEKFNLQVGCGGWVTTRASLLGALYEQFRIRKFDYSEIRGEREGYSLNRKVKLIGKSIKEIPNS